MEYNECSDEAPKTDLQDSEDHACRPEDPGATTSWSHKK